MKATNMITAMQTSAKPPRLAETDQDTGAAARLWQTTPGSSDRVYCIVSLLTRPYPQGRWAPPTDRGPGPGRYPGSLQPARARDARTPSSILKLPRP
jgi:hypothetical protein